ncbi:MAG: hypothetical protein PHQ22_05870 [Sulfuricurvum sp.]|nr:hypothetical protein [Sulfuricurvum sp.]MDD5386702.1 hypothetical protein [Sulfuricurvum sp.]
MYLFFAILNFTFSGAIFVIGILTLRKVSTPNEVVFASLPLLFALHQFTEGFVWLGVSHLIEPSALKLAEGIFIFYAQGLLPFLVPLAIWLLEPSGVRKKLISLLMIVGALITAYTVWGLSIQPTSVSVQNNSLAYVNLWTDNRLVGISYILTTCGSLILSRGISIQLFGWLNFFGLIVIYLLKPYSFTSLWCFYAAIASVLLYFYFIERRIEFLYKIKQKEDGLSKILDNELNILKERYPFLIKKVYNFLQD